MRVKWSDKAKQTWKESFEYCVSNYGVHFGKKLSDILLKKTTSLSACPEIGSPMPKLDSANYSYRSVVLYKDYKIIYRIDYQNDYVIIIDIVNMRMDYDNLRKKVSGK